MVLSPIDIEQKTFRVALRGYAEEEVDQFLDEIVIAIREYERQLRDANERVAVLEEQLEANREPRTGSRRPWSSLSEPPIRWSRKLGRKPQQLLIEARTKASEVEVERIQERENLVADLDRMRFVGRQGSKRGSWVWPTRLWGISRRSKRTSLPSQPDRDDVESWDDLPVDLEVDDLMTMKTSTRTNPRNPRAIGMTKMTKARSRIRGTQGEESTGQVILGSGLRPLGEGTSPTTRRLTGRGRGSVLWHRATLDLDRHGLIRRYRWGTIHLILSHERSGPEPRRRWSRPKSGKPPASCWERA